jgi:integrase
MASIWRHPKSQYYSACYTNRHGVQVKRSTKCSDKGKATQIAFEFERVEAIARSGNLVTVQVQKVLNDVVEKTIGDTILAPSVEVYFNNWLEAKKVKNAAGTAERYGNTVKLFLKFLDSTAKRPITALTAAHIDGFLTHRLQNGAAPKTAIVDIKTLSTALNRAERQGIILKNPALAVELPKNESSEREIFSHEQIGLLLSEVGSTSNWFTLILLGYYTGARLNDCVSMRWDNVDLRKGVIFYRQQKTGKQVVVPIHVQLYEHLDFLIEFEQSGFLCPELALRGSGGKNGLSESFNRIVKRAGIDPQNIQGKGKRKFNKLSFHSLRHSFNSALANAGVNQEIRMKLTGHSSSAMNAKYTHHNITPLQSAIKVLPAFSEAS